MNQMMEKLLAIEDRYREVSLLIVDPGVISDGKRYPILMKEYKDLGKLVVLILEYKNVVANVTSSKELLKQEVDPEMKEMAKEELQEFIERENSLMEELKMALIPKDPVDSKNVVVELRAGAGRR